MYIFCIHLAIKERALAKHKSSETHVPVAKGSHYQVSKFSSPNIEDSEAHTNGKQWRMVYSKYRGSETKQQSSQVLRSERSTSVPTPNHLHSTTTAVTFPGFANLGVRKDQRSRLTKHTSVESDAGNVPVMPLQVDKEIKLEKTVRPGYLMPDEELLQKWTDNS